MERLWLEILPHIDVDLVETLWVIVVEMRDLQFDLEVLLLASCNTLSVSYNIDVLLLVRRPIAFASVVYVTSSLNVAE